MKESRFWLLLSKKMAGEASEDELQEFSYWMGEKDFPYHEDHQLVDELWQQPFDEEEVPDGQANWSVLAGKLALKRAGTSDVPRRGLLKNFSWRSWAVAAFIVLLAGVGFIYVHTATARSGARALKNTGIRQNDVYARNGTHTKLVLPDGSTLWLNGGSRLYYNKSFGHDDREVYLTGEGYFEVTANASLPFIVHAGGVNIRVLGTSFNMKAYPDEKKIETILIKGNIELTLDCDPGRKVLLKPMEKLTLTDEAAAKNDKNEKETGMKAPAYVIDRILSTPTDSSLAETGWLNNIFVFRAKPFKELAREIERWYGVTLVFENRAMETRKFTGVFDRLSLEEAMEALRFSSKNGFNYEVKNSEVIIR